MVVAQSDLRRATLASYPVARAFLLSLLFHALLFGTIELGNKTGLWKASFLLSRRQALKEAEIARQLRQAREREQEMPLVFVQVDPATATEEPPKEAKYYSAVNSQAANPDTSLDTRQPKIDGTQDRVPQTLEKSRPDPEPLQAASPPPQPPVERKPEPPPPTPAPEPEPPPKPGPGDLALSKPFDKPRPTNPQLDRPKPANTRVRTLEAARRQKGYVAGEKMRQSGGVKRHGLASSLDVRGTPFGSYDSLIIAAIQKRWYDLLESRDFAANYSGKVVLEFRLNSDGRVTDMKVSENSVTEILALLCQRAVQDPAPFEPWPTDLRRLVGKEYREVRFTFYYN